MVNMTNLLRAVKALEAYAQRNIAVENLIIDCAEAVEKQDEALKANLSRLLDHKDE